MSFWINRIIGFAALVVVAILSGIFSHRDEAANDIVPAPNFLKKIRTKYHRR